MVSTVSSQMGRRWLNKQHRAKTAFETEDASPSSDHGQTEALLNNATANEVLTDASVANDILPMTDLSSKATVKPGFEQGFAEKTLVGQDTVELAAGKPRGPRFETESIYQQLCGTDEIPAVQHLDLLDTKPMNENAINHVSGAGSVRESSEHQIVFVNVPNVTKDGSNTERAAATEAVDSSADMKIVSVHPEDAIPDELTGGYVPNDLGRTAHHGDERETVAENHGRHNEAGSTEQIHSLVNSIFERFPLAAPAVLLFVGTEQNPHVDEMCAKVAAAIASRNVGNVLLVDADVEGKKLSSASGLSSHEGLTECINRNHPWKEKIVSQKSSSFSFLPAGNCDMDRWNVKQLLRNAVAEMKGNYQFVCVSAGDTHSSHANLWFDICDGTYLIVSMQSSNESYAKSSVDLLRSNGARLLGCVVTDAVEETA